MLTFRVGQFNSSSLLICYDGSDSKSKEKMVVKFIDFDQYIKGDKPNGNEEILNGLKNLLYYFVKIYDNI